MRCMAASSAEMEPCRCAREPPHLFFLRLQITQPRLDEVELAFALLNQACSVDEPFIDALALGR